MKIDVLLTYIMWITAISIALILMFRSLFDNVILELGLFLSWMFPAGYIVERKSSNEEMLNKKSTKVLAPKTWLIAFVGANIGVVMQVVFLHSIQIESYVYMIPLWLIGFPIAFGLGSILSRKVMILAATKD